MSTRREKWSGREEEEKKRRRGQLPTEVNPVSHSGCGCERVSRQKGKRYRRRGGTERIEGEEERNGAGKVFSHGVGGEKGRKLMVPGVVPPSSFFFSFFLFPANTSPSPSFPSPPALTLNESTNFPRD